MKFKSEMALFVAIIMVISSLAGCGKSGETSGEKSLSNLKLNGDKIYPIESEDTLSFWFYDSSSWAYKYNNFAETPLAQELVRRTGVKVEYMHPNKGMEMEQFNLLLASDKLPDLVNNGWSFFGGGPDAAIEQGYIHKLNDVIDKYSPAFRTYLDNDPEIDKQVKTDSGAYFAYPVIAEEGTGKLLVTYGPVLRSDWMEELGLSYPTTMDEWDEVLSAIKTKKGLNTSWMGALGQLSTAFMPGFGSYPDWYKDGNVIKYGQMQPQYKDFLTKMNEWYNKGIIDTDFAVTDSKTLNAKMLKGEAAGCLAWAGSGIGTYLQNNGQEGYDLKAFQYPALKSGEKSEYSYFGKRVSMDAIATAISTNCKNVELAARFLDFGYTEEGQMLYNYGIEGESYNMVEKDEPFPEYSDLVVKNPEGYTIANMLAVYSRSANGSAPFVQHENYIVQYYPYEQQKKAQVEWAKTNMGEHLIPQIYVSVEDSDEDSNIMANIRTYVDEMSMKFITGKEPLDNFDDYIEQLKAFGIEKSVKFRQEALEKYNNR